MEQATRLGGPLWDDSEEMRGKRGGLVARAAAQSARLGGAVAALLVLSKVEEDCFYYCHTITATININYNSSNHMENAHTGAKK